MSVVTGNVEVAFVAVQRALPVGPPTLNDPHSGTSIRRTKTAVFPASTAVTKPTRRSLRGVLNGDGRQERSLLLLFGTVKLSQVIYTRPAQYREPAAAWGRVVRVTLERQGAKCVDSKQISTPEISADQAGRQAGRSAIITCENLCGLQRHNNPQPADLRSRQQQW